MYGLILGLFLLAAGCGPTISTGLQQKAGPEVGFAQLAANPDRYQGRVVILGGEVMTVQPWGERGSLLEVDQRSLDDRLYPIGTTSGGSFLVESDQWLNSNFYQPKSKVTVAGVVEGQKNGVLLLKSSQIHLWGPPTWEKYYYPVPRSWYPPEMEYWFTPPFFDIYRGGGMK